MKPRHRTAIRRLAASVPPALPGVMLLLLLSAAPAHASAEVDNGRLSSVLGQGQWGPGATPQVGDGQRGSGERARRGRRVASLGGTAPDFDKPSVTGGGRITWHASSSCLNGRLAAVVAEVAANFGPVRVSSTCRSHGRNARVGGAPRSHHLTGNAVDFRVFGNVGAVRSFLRGHSAVGGLKHYGGGLFHIDTGARRPM